jgi:16S rRNA (cytosine967-C5)-methyltransferase
MTPAARIQAVIDILGELERTHQPVDRHLRDWGRAHRFAGSKDRAAIAERVYAIQRRRAWLGWRMASDAPRALAIGSLLDEGDIEALFNGGGYGPSALTEAERASIAAAPSDEPPPHVRGEYPQFLEAELRRAFGDALMDEMIAFQTRAPADLRVNTLKMSRDDLLDALSSEGYDAQPTPFSPIGIRLSEGEAKLGRGGLFLAGAFEFQDEAAQIAALLCGAQPEMRVLDLAAGAGGKSLALAAIMRNEGEIVACDVRTDALTELERRAMRAGATIIQTMNLPRPHEVGERAGVRGRQTQNSIDPPPHPDPLPLKGGEGNYDVVLLDAPCSGTGTWRRQPELRWRLTPERLAELRATQGALLNQAAASVKPGGRLVYATCSILPSENEDRVSAFLETHPDFAVTPVADIWRQMTGCEQPMTRGHFFHASPFSTGTDGFFTAVLQKRPG